MILSIMLDVETVMKRSVLLSIADELKTITNSNWKKNFMQLLQLQVMHLQGGNKQKHTVSLNKDMMLNFCSNNNYS